MIWEVVAKVCGERAAEITCDWVVGTEKLKHLQHEIHANRELLRQRALAAASAKDLEPMTSYTLPYSRTIYDRQEYWVRENLRGPITDVYAKLKHLEDLGKQLQERFSLNAFEEYVPLLGKVLVETTLVEERLANRTKLPMDPQQNEEDRKLGVLCEVLPKEERRGFKD